MSFWRLYYHLVWSTKDRQHLIQPDGEAQLYAYLVNKAAELDVYVYAINGWFDHIHMVVAIPPKHAVADVVKRLKGSSSHDLNKSGKPDRVFAWQPGYGVLSLGEKQKPTAIAYVENQKRHHAEQTTNVWLEQITELEQGPADAGMRPGQPSSVVREAGIEYIELGNAPF